MKIESISPNMHYRYCEILYKKKETTKRISNKAENDTVEISKEAYELFRNIKN